MSSTGRNDGNDSTVNNLTCSRVLRQLS